MTTAARRAAEQAARGSYGKLVALLAARNRDLAAAEDALSDALVAALKVWPDRGVPANPDAWLLTAARNRQRNAARAGHVRRAAEHGRSAEAEHREILRQALEEEPRRSFKELAAQVRAMTEGRHHTPAEILLREARDER